MTYTPCLPLRHVASVWTMQKGWRTEVYAETGAILKPKHTYTLRSRGPLHLRSRLHRWMWQFERVYCGWESCLPEDLVSPLVRSMVGGCPLTVVSQNCQNRHLSSKVNEKYFRYWCKRWSPNNNSSSSNNNNNNHHHHNNHNNKHNNHNNNNHHHNNHHSNHHNSNNNHNSKKKKKKKNKNTDKSKNQHQHQQHLTNSLFLYLLLL